MEWSAEREWTDGEDRTELSYKRAHSSTRTAAGEEKRMKVGPSQVRGCCVGVGGVRVAEGRGGSGGGGGGVMGSGGVTGLGVPRASLRVRDR